MKKQDFQTMQKQNEPVEQAYLDSITHIPSYLFYPIDLHIKIKVSREYEQDYDESAKLDNSEPGMYVVNT